MKVVAIIPAAGLGLRMGGDVPKQFLEIGGRPLLTHTLENVSRANLIDGIVLVVEEWRIPDVRDQFLRDWPCPKVKWVIAGGARRQDSVAKGLASVPAETEIVVVHDGARPFINPGIIDRSVKEARLHGACIVAIPVSDTIKRVDDEGVICETVDRSGLWQAQTPQTFRFDLIKKAMAKAVEEGFYATDEAGLVERIGMAVMIIPGDQKNMKVTTPEDLVIARTLVLSYSRTLE